MNITNDFSHASLYMSRLNKVTKLLFMLLKMKTYEKLKQTRPLYNIACQFYCYDRMWTWNSRIPRYCLYADREYTSNSRQFARSPFRRPHPTMIKPTQRRRLTPTKHLINFAIVYMFRFNFLVGCRKKKTTTHLRVVFSWRLYACIAYVCLSVHFF